MSQIGPLFSPHLIEEGVLARLQRALPLYIQEAEAQYGVKLPAISSWGLVDEGEDERKPEQGFPALVVVAGGTGKGGEPEEYSGGWYRSAWAVTVLLAVQHPERVVARKLAQIYGAVIRGAVLQERSLEGAGRVAKWTGELNPFETSQERTEAASENFFLVQQDEVVNWQMGPKGELPDAPAGEDPEVTEIEVDAEVSE
jgi:hypothetical protein